MGVKSKNSDQALPSRPLTPEEIQNLVPEIDSAEVKVKFAPLLDGSLSEAERAELQREDPLGYALFSPLAAPQVDALTARLMQEIGVSNDDKSVPLAAPLPDAAVIPSLAEARARQRRRMKQAAWVGGPLLALALAAGLLIFPMNEQPDYQVTQLVSRPARTLSRPEPDPGPEQTLAPEQLFTLQLNPRQSPTHPVELRPYIERAGALTPWPVNFELADGAFLLRKSVGELFGAQATGRVTIWLAVGTAAALPKSPAQFDELRRRDPTGRSAGLFIYQHTYDLKGSPPSQ